MATIDAQGNLTGTGSIIPSTPVVSQPPVQPPAAIPPQSDTQRAAASKDSGQTPAVTGPDLTNAGKPGYDVFGNPVASTTQQDYAGNTVSTTATTPAGGTYTASDGNQYYNANGKPVLPTPTTQTTTSAQSPYVGGVDSNGQPVLSDQTDRQTLAQAQADYQAQAAQVSSTITNIQNGTTPLTAGEQAQVDGLKQQFQTLVDQQTLQNTGASGAANIRGYQTGAAEYDPTFQVKTVGAIVSAGLQKISDLQIQEASAVAKLTQGFKDSDIAAVKDAWSLYQDASTSRTTALQKVIDDTSTAIKAAQDAQVAADKTYYDEVTKPIQDIQDTLTKAGAPKEVLTAAGNAQSVDEALSAGGVYLQSSTNPDVASYLFYQQQATSAGQTPISYSDYQTQQAQIAASAAYSKAYATAAGTAAGTASALPSPTPDSPGSGLGGTDNGGSILSTTGLSVAAFNFLTQGTASMSRMTAAQRTAIMGEAQNWLNKNGVDISTFQSQYKAYNEVVQNNIARANNTTIAAQEISGTVDQFIKDFTPTDVNKGGLFGLGSNTLSAENVVDLMAGKEVNNSLATKYSFDIQTMANDLASYYAASRSVGSSGTVPTPDDADKAAAAKVIADGINTGSAQAFKDSINNNEAKVTGVVNNAVSAAQKNVWNLFGVGDQYKSKTNTTDSLVQQNQDNPLNIDLSSTTANNNNPIGI